jgi:hypothetical protein
MKTQQEKGVKWPVTNGQIKMGMDVYFKEVKISDE